ncbi:MAG: CHAT domain-containing protein [Spirosomataceae bacterium]
MAQPINDVQLWQEVNRYTQKNQDQKAINKLQVLQQLYQQKKDTNRLIYVYYEVGNRYYDLENFKTSLFKLQAGWKLALAKRYIPDSLLIRLCISLSNTYTEITSKTDSSRFFALQAAKVLEKSPSLKTRFAKTLGVFFINEGSVAIDEGDFTNALFYLNKAWAIAKQDPFYKSLIASHFANVYLKQNQLLLADSAISITLKEYPHQDQYRGWFEILAARIALQRSDFTAARLHLDNAYKTYQSLPSDNQNFDLLRYIYLRRGQLFQRLPGQATYAITCFEKVIQISDEHYGTKGNIIAEAFLGLSKIYQQESNLPKALTTVQEGLIRASVLFNNHDVAANPTANDYISSPTLFELLQHKASLLTQTSPALSLSTYQRGLEVASYIRKEISSTQSRLFFLQQRVDVLFEKALDLAYRLGDQQAFLWLIEQNRAITLSDWLAESTLKPKYLPQAVLDKDAQLHKRVTALKMELVTQPNAQKEAELQDAFLAIKRFESEIAQQYPHYAQAKHIGSTISLSAIQGRLSDEMAYIAFHVAKNKLYTLLITHSEVTIKAQTIDNTFLEKQVSTLRLALSHDPKVGRYTGSEASQFLYKILFKPLQELLLAKTRLIVSKNETLNLIPFDVLESSPSHFMVEQYAITNAYNASLQFTPHNTPLVNPSLFVFAPFATNGTDYIVKGDTLKPLPATINECRKLGGTLFSNKNARKTAFLLTQQQQSLQTGAIIYHFATHSVGNDKRPEQSFVAFHPSASEEFRLYTEEIQNLNLRNVRLAVLNSCSSAYGQLLENEGLLSLGRAFTQAGTGAVAAALWEEDDATGSHISILFHQYLQEGFPIDIALQKAKLAYLQTPPNDTFRDMRHPYFWASIILHGDSSSVYYTQKWIWIGGLALLLVSTVGFLLWKKYR